MIISLHVKNMALIEEVEVEFGRGLNILTGETGAGKSIILGAVNIALGTGNFRNFVPEGAEYALVELVFSSSQTSVRARLEEMDIPFEDGEVIISRRYKNGRSISKVNGETVPVSFVRELASDLIDIHGQHEHQSLLYPAKHLEILDKYAGGELAGWKEQCARQYRAYTAAQKKLAKARHEEAGRAKEMDFLQFELQEIEAASLQPGEDQELENQYRLMANGQKIIEALSEAGALTGCGGGGGAADSVGHALRAMGQVSDFDQEIGSLCGMLEEIEGLMNDFNRAMADYMDGFSFDGQEMQRIEERLDLLNRLKAKYGKTLEDILAYQKEREERLHVLENYEEYLIQLRADYEKCSKEILMTSRKISEIRRRCAKELSEKITAALVDLNFLDVRFQIEFELLDRPCEHGMDSVCFQISTNPGMPLRPLGDVASGGELSRIMLAIKAVMADQDAVDTLIFDEIDTGISGRTAQKVSEKMAVIARNHQIICITHLAQIASMADEHFMIEKHPSGSRTVTTIEELSEEESIAELARILGGAKITQAVLDNAREMKELAADTKKY